MGVGVAVGSGVGVGVVVGSGVGVAVGSGVGVGVAVGSGVSVGVVVVSPGVAISASVGSEEGVLQAASRSMSTRPGRRCRTCVVAIWDLPRQRRVKAFPR